jgi:hypothetical protein
MIQLTGRILSTECYPNLSNLEEPSLTSIIMDNATYHSVLLEKPPTEMEKGHNNCLTAREKNYLLTGSFQG